MYLNHLNYQKYDAFDVFYSVRRFLDIIGLKNIVLHIKILTNIPSISQ